MIENFKSWVEANSTGLLAIFVLFTGLKALWWLVKPAVIAARTQLKQRAFKLHKDGQISTRPTSFGYIMFSSLCMSLYSVWSVALLQSAWAKEPDTFSTWSLATILGLVGAAAFVGYLMSVRTAVYRKWAHDLLEEEKLERAKQVAINAEYVRDRERERNMNARDELQKRFEKQLDAKLAEEKTAVERMLDDRLFKHLTAGMGNVGGQLYGGLRLTRHPNPSDPNPSENVHITLDPDTIVVSADEWAAMKANQKLFAERFNEVLEVLKVIGVPKAPYGSKVVRDIDIEPISTGSRRDHRTATGGGHGWSWPRST